MFPFTRLASIYWIVTIRLSVLLASTYIVDSNNQIERTASEAAIVSHWELLVHVHKVTACVGTCAQSNHVVSCRLQILLA
jgi:hypothetical protein